MLWLTVQRTFGDLEVLKKGSNRDPVTKKLRTLEKSDPLTQKDFCRDLVPKNGTLSEQCLLRGNK